MIRAAVAVVDRVIFREYRACARDLALARVLVAGYLLVQLPQGQRVTSLPQAFYNPPLSVGVLFDDFASPGVLLALNAAAVTAVLCLLIGYRTKAASITTTVMFIILQSLVFATGKIDHTILPILAPAVMAWSGWGDVWSADAAVGRVRHLDPGARHPRWQLAWMAVIIAIAMATAGLVKIESGWLGLDVASSYGHAMANAILNGRETLVGDLMLRMPSRMLWESLDWATVIVESAGLLAWWRAQWFRAWLVALAAFHLGVALHMDIWFSANLVAYALFVPRASVVEPLGRRLVHPTLRIRLATAMAVLLVARVALEWMPATAVSAALVAQLLQRSIVVAALPLAVSVWLVERRQARRVKPDATTSSDLPVVEDAEAVGVPPQR